MELQKQATLELACEQDVGSANELITAQTSLTSTRSSLQLPVNKLKSAATTTAPKLMGRKIPTKNPSMRALAFK